jgi:hypothetical protein
LFPPPIPPLYLVEEDCLLFLDKKTERLLPADHATEDVAVFWEKLPLMLTGEETPSDDLRADHFAPWWNGVFDTDEVGAVLDALELGVYLQGQGNGCGNFDPNDLPSVNSLEDLPALRNYVECAAEAIHDSAARIALPEVPEDLLARFRRAGLDSYFPGLRGAKLEAYLAIEQSLQRFADEAGVIRTTLYLLSQDLEIYRAAVDRASAEGEITRLQVAAANAVGGIRAVLGFVSSLLGGGVGGLGDLGGAIATGVYGARIGAESGRATEAAIDGATAELMKSAALQLEALRQSAASMTDAFTRAQVSLNALGELKRQGARARARALFETSDEADVTYRVNEAMRNWLATDRLRYGQLLDQAKRMAFVARRAIEFRLGLDMTGMTRSMSLVSPPAAWVDDICRMRGMDYDHLSGRERIRGPDDSEEPVAGTPAWDEWNGRFVGGYVGDYVRMLRLFVESFSMDFPFADGSDVAVISLKDVKVNPSVPCERPSRNHVLFSGEPGKGAAEIGWEVVGCAEEPICTEAPCGYGSEDTGPPCIVVETGLPGEDFSIPLRTASRLTVPAGTPDVPQKFVRQRISGLTAGGRYLLTWWSGPVGASSEFYGVEVWNASGSALVSTQHRAQPGSEGIRVGLFVEVPEGETEIDVRIYPTAPESAAFGYLAEGAMAIAGVQLEEYAGPEPPSPAAAGWFARPYEEVTDTRTVLQARCDDVGGDVFREFFRREVVCPGNPGGGCGAPDLAAGRERAARRLEFAVTLDDVNGRGLIPSALISPYNFNYRIEEIGINVVGTGVHACTLGASRESCYGAAYLPVTLIHQGAVEVRDYEGQDQSFSMPTARIEHGKAMAAELFLTNPPTSSQWALIGQYMKDEMRGRPLNGSYILRIWEVPELDWSRVEDIQLVVRYRYWTRMD